MRRGPLLLAAVLLSPHAAASDTPEKPQSQGRLLEAVYLGSGILLSGSKRPEGLVPGVGLEVSLHALSAGELEWGLGLFGQWQWMGLDSHRFDAGVQATLFDAGLEVGGTYQTAGASRAATTGLHFAPFLSFLGVATVSIRLGLPLHHDGADGRPGHGYDVGLGLAFKLPLPLYRAAQ